MAPLTFIYLSTMNSRRRRQNGERVGPCRRRRDALTDAYIRVYDVETSMYSIRRHYARRGTRRAVSVPSRRHGIT